MPELKQRPSLIVGLTALMIAVFVTIVVVANLGSARPEREVDRPATAQQPTTALVPQGTPTREGNQPDDPDSLADGTAPRAGR